MIWSSIQTAPELFAEFAREVHVRVVAARVASAKQLHEVVKNVVMQSKNTYIHTDHCMRKYEHCRWSVALGYVDGTLNSWLRGGIVSEKNADNAIRGSTRTQSLPTYHWHLRRHRDIQSNNKRAVKQLCPKRVNAAWKQKSSCSSHNDPCTYWNKELHLLHTKIESYTHINFSASSVQGTYQACIKENASRREPEAKRTVKAPKEVLASQNIFLTPLQCFHFQSFIMIWIVFRPFHT